MAMSTAAATAAAALLYTTTLPALLALATRHARAMATTALAHATAAVALPRLPQRRTLLASLLAPLGAPLFGVDAALHCMDTPLARVATVALARVPAPLWAPASAALAPGGRLLAQTLAAALGAALRAAASAAPGATAPWAALLAGGLPRLGNSVHGGGERTLGDSQRIGIISSHVGFYT